MNAAARHLVAFALEMLFGSFLETPRCDSLDIDVDHAHVATL